MGFLLKILCLMNFMLSFIQPSADVNLELYEAGVCETPLRKMNTFLGENNLGPSSYPLHPGSCHDLGLSSYPFHPGSNTGIDSYFLFFSSIHWDRYLLERN